MGSSITLIILGFPFDESYDMVGNTNGGYSGARESAYQ